jgi:cobalt transporter subunit CbtA
MLFRRIVLYAVLVGVVGGLLLTAVQTWQVVPIIQSAERFEGAPVTAAPQGSAGYPSTAHGHDHGAHDHSAGAWAPSDGAERTAYTLLANVLIAIGLALIMLAAMVASLKTHAATKLDWRYGILWGGAGYAVFFLAPALGLPPEIPGAAAAPLEARQLWWLLAVVCTAAGLAGLAFGKSPWRWAALGLLVAPHLVGAPHPPTAMFADQSPAAAAELETLAGQFIGATAIANATLWLALGLASAWALRRIVPHAD